MATEFTNDYKGVVIPRELAKFQESGIRVIGKVTLGEQVQSPKLLVVGLELRKTALLANAGHKFSLSQLVPEAPAGAVLIKVALRYQRPERLDATSTNCPTILVTRTCILPSSIKK